MTALQVAVAQAVAAVPGVRWGVHVRDAATGEVLAASGDDEVLPVASVGKLLLLVEVARRCAAGDGGRLLSRASVPPVADSGLWQHLRVDALPVHDCAALVGAVSDNLATNVLLHDVGLPAVDAVAAALGLHVTRLHDAVRDERGPQDPPRLATGSARELAGLLGRLHRGEVEGAAQVLRWLAAGTDLSMVASAFGLDPLAHADPDRGVRLLAKTGTDRGVRADVGVVAGRRTLAYAVLAAWPDGEDRRDDVLGAMRAVGTGLRAQVQ